MENVTIHEAKTNLSRLIEKACKGEEVVISRGKQPVVKLVAIHPHKRTPGRLRGQLSFSPDTFDPLTDKDLTELGWDESF